MIGDRQVLDGVDFTMMYVAHDAFAHDPGRVAAAVGRSKAFTPATRTGWAMFARQLHIHHTSEDNALWPRLRAQPLGPDEAQVLDAMETEPAQLDPQLERAEAAFADCDAVLRLVSSRGRSRRLEDRDTSTRVPTEEAPQRATLVACPAGRP